MDEYYPNDLRLKKLRVGSNVLVYLWGDVVDFEIRKDVIKGFDENLLITEAGYRFHRKTGIGCDVTGSFSSLMIVPTTETNKAIYTLKLSCTVVDDKLVEMQNEIKSLQSFLAEQKLSGRLPAREYETDINSMKRDLSVCLELARSASHRIKSAIFEDDLGVSI